MRNLFALSTGYEPRFQCSTMKYPRSTGCSAWHNSESDIFEDPTQATRLLIQTYDKNAMNFVLLVGKGEVLISTFRAVIWLITCKSLTSC